ncbi:MAG: phenylalanine--tRNA ligase subunit beta [Bacteroidaceae bacterium]
MNISYNWLKEYVGTALSAQEVADALTSVGLETGGVNEVQSIKGGLEGLVVGHVLTCVEHPNSDHLHVTTVDLGNNEVPVQIVCGAPNVATGQKVIVATVGTVLYDGDKEFKIKKGKMRGEESLGMICAEDEIGVGASHDGIIVLPADTEVGMKAATYYDVESDYVIEVDITPNRADACSHYGTARDLYAYLVQQGVPAAIKSPDVDSFKVDNHDMEIKINVENSEACPRFTAVAMKGITVKESPKWLQDKLRIIGLRPINNVVDVTNYICHAFGQPMHCYDAAKITTGEIRVKTLPSGTPFTTLDGVERKLDERDLMVCNGDEPMCIAGVFGGMNSGATMETKDIVLESAYFHPTWVRKAAKRHGQNTDASFRFERGVDANNTEYCLKLAAILIKELAGGEVASEIIDIYPKKLSNFEVNVTYKRINSLIGKEIPVAMVKSIVTSLEMKILKEDAEGLMLEVPSYRVDVQRDADVIEDILRLYGYNNVEIPTSYKASLVAKSKEDRSHKLENLASEQLVGAGFQEILNNSLTRGAYYDKLTTYASENLVRLINPLSNDLNTLRQTLLFGGLESLAYNIKRQNANLRLFEVGNCYQFDKEKNESGETVTSGYSETHNFGLIMTGKKVANSWACSEEENSVFELKAQLMNIFRRVGLDMGKIVMTPISNDIYASGISITTRGDKVLATFGILQAPLVAQFNIAQEVNYAEINWTELMKQTRKSAVSYTELSKFPAVRRDLALLISDDVLFSDIEAIAYKCERKLLKSVSLFDVYEGKNLPEGKKSYAVKFMLQDEQKTLNDKVIDKVMQKIIDNLQSQIGAELR